MLDSKYDSGAYPYLVDPEDRAFAMCMRLDEDKFLEMAGGLKKYTQFRLDRQTARGAKIESQAGGEPLTFFVPQLPDNTEAALARITVPGVKVEDYAAYLLKEQMQKIQGIMDALRATRTFKDMAERAATESAIMRTNAISKLASRNPYSWKADSQSAKDWAEAEYAKQQRR